MALQSTSQSHDDDDDDDVDAFLLTKIQRKIHKQHRTQFHVLLTHRSSSSPSHKYFRKKLSIYNTAHFSQSTLSGPRAPRQQKVGGETDQFGDIRATDSSNLIKIFGSITERNSIL